MKKSRLPTIIAIASISLLVFLIAFNSVILGNEKTVEPTMETLLSQVQDLEKVVKAVKERVSKLEGEQKMPLTVPQAKSPIVPEYLPSVNVTPRVISPAVPQAKPPIMSRDLPFVNTTPDMNQLPKGSVRKEFNDMTYYIIPLQNQNVDK
jgi:hypothetical protein